MNEALEIKRYEPHEFDDLSAFASQLSFECPLSHQSFVNYYYTTSNFCHLYTLRNNKNGVIGSVGVEKMPFKYRDKPMTLANGSNFNVLTKGVGHGKILFTKWLGEGDFGIVFGGSADTHNILRKQEWDYFDGANLMRYNEPMKIYATDPIWKRVIKKALKLIPGPSLNHSLRKISTSFPLYNELRSIECDYNDVDLPTESPFDFYFNPTREYLDWRYSTDLDFVNYRLFRIEDSIGMQVGYVILNLKPGIVMVAHTDGSDHMKLALGIIRCLECIGDLNENLAIYLVSSQIKMQEIFCHFGFKLSKHNRELAIGAIKKPTNIDQNTSNWIINFDWGDNGLRLPFLV